MMNLILSGGRSSQSYADTVNPDHIVGTCLLMAAVAGVLYYLVHIGYFDEVLRKLSGKDEGQSVAEYSMMLAGILLLVWIVVRTVGNSANNVFSSVASSIN